MKISSVIIFFLLLSCAGAPTPPWDSSPDAIQLIYHDNEYIAMRGRGHTRSGAEANGAAQIALFFNSQIRSELRITEREIINNRNIQSSSEIESETFVRSQIIVFGIRYAQDAYFNKAQNEWITVAYINREEAWQVYAPRFNQQTQVFLRLIEEAEKDTDPFRKSLRLMTANSYAASPNFQNAEIFGQLLHPVRMNREFASVRAQNARLPVLFDNARKNASIYVECPNDFESIVTTAISREIAALGFPVANNKNTAAAVCAITINEGRQQRDLGVFYHPSLQAIISNNAGTHFTFNIEGERAQAVTPDVAKRRAYQSLAEKVRNNFSAEFIRQPLLLNNNNFLNPE